MRESSVHGELRVLIHSQDHKLRQLVREAVAQESTLNSLVAECDQWEAAVAQLSDREFDLVVLDADVTRTEWLAKHGCKAAIVAIAANPDGPTLQQVMAAGATDYFSKPEYREDPAVLWLALRQSLRYQSALNARGRLTAVLRDRDTMISNLAQRLWRDAAYDFRTGWFTHREIVNRLHEETNRSERYGLPLALIMGEIKGLATIGQDLDERFVDSIYAQVSARTKQVCRQTDVVGHYGNDAFLVLLTNTDQNGAEQFCQRHGDSFEEPIVIGDDETKLSFVYGIVTHDASSPKTVSQMLQLAEERLENARS